LLLVDKISSFVFSLIVNMSVKCYNKMCFNKCSKCVYNLNPLQ